MSNYSRTAGLRRIGRWLSHNVPNIGLGPITDDHSSKFTRIIVDLLFVCCKNAKYFNGPNLQGNLTNSKVDMTDDKDMVDNKGAYQPTTNIVTNPRPKSQLSYEAVSFNQKKDGVFSSEYKITIKIPVGGWVDEIKRSAMFTSCKQIPTEGDAGANSLSTISAPSTGPRRASAWD